MAQRLYFNRLVSRLKLKRYCYNIVDALPGFRRVYTPSRFPLRGSENADGNGAAGSLSRFRQRFPAGTVGFHRRPDRQNTNVSYALRYCFNPCALIFLAALISLLCTVPHLGQTQVVFL